MPHPAGGNRPLYFLADVPHLLKNFRGAFSKHHFYLPERIVKEENLPTNYATVNHVKMLVDYQKNHVLKLAPFLSEADVMPTHFTKMDVGSALRLFSHDVAAALTFLVEKKEYPKELLTTAWLIRRVRNWFDLMSSRCRKTALSRAKPEIYEKAIESLKYFREMVREMKIGEQGRWTPSQTGIVLSTTAVLSLQEYLLDSGFQFILTSRFSQDKLENLFSQIRRRRATPTAYEFKNALKIVTIAQFLHRPRGCNYQEDDGSYIADFLSANPSAKQTTENRELDEDFILDLMDTANLTEVKTLEADILYNLCGYVIHSVQLRSKIKCKKCLAVLLSKDKEFDDNGFSDLVKLRDYTGSSLTYCSRLIFEKIFMPMEELFLKLDTVHDMITKKNVQEKLVSHFMNVLEDVLPACCLLKKRLITRYIVLRLKITAKEYTTMKREEAKQKKNGGERGSRSMTMKKTVEELK